MKQNTNEYDQVAIAVCIVMLLLGISIGLNIGQHQICLNKDLMIGILMRECPNQKPQKEVKSQCPKNLPLIADLK